MKRILAEQIRIQPGSPSPRATDNRKDKRGEKYPFFPSFKDDIDSAATVTTSSAALSPEQ